MLPVSVMGDKHMVDPAMQLQWSARWGIPATKAAALDPGFSKVAEFKWSVSESS